MPEPGGSVLKFTGITHSGKVGTGVLKLNEAQLGWGSTEAVPGGAPHHTVSFVGSDLAAAHWQRVCGKGKAMLKLRFKGVSGMSRFSGFRYEDFDSLRDHMKKHYGVALTEQEVSTKGGSWFDWSLESAGELQLTVDGKAAISVPLEDLSQVTTLGKNELNLQFQEAAGLPGDEAIYEMRLALPAGDAVPELSAEQLREELQKRTGLSAAGEAIARIPEITVVQPRGKHDFEFFQQAVKVRGKTHTFTIKYAAITKAFLLEQPGDTCLFVMHMDPPLRPQGSQILSFLVLTFDKERHMPVELPADMLKALKLTAGESLPVVTLVSKLIPQLIKKAVIAPSTEFKNLFQKDGEFCVRCSVKTQPGFLFPMKRSMIFVAKPVIYIKNDEVESIQFKSNDMRKSSFDLLIQTKRQQVVEFSQLDRAKNGGVLGPVLRFFQMMQLNIANAEEAEGWLMSSTSRSSKPPSLPTSSGGKRAAEPDVDDEEEDDEDFDENEEASDGGGDSSAGDDDDDPFDDDEPKKKRPKRGK